MTKSVLSHMKVLSRGWKKRMLTQCLPIYRPVIIIIISVHHYPQVLRYSLQVDFIHLLHEDGAKDFEE